MYNKKIPRDQQFIQMILDTKPGPHKDKREKRRQNKEAKKDELEEFDDEDDDENFQYFEKSRRRK